MDTASTVKDRSFSDILIIAGTPADALPLEGVLSTCGVPLAVGVAVYTGLTDLLPNLLSNALKYSAQGKTVTMTLSADEGHVRLMVRDEGIGIPADEMKHLFQPFHRARNVGTIAGTGLGLSIARQAVGLHGGTITAESQLGKGTTVWVNLPMPAPASATSPDEIVQNHNDQE